VYLDQCKGVILRLKNPLQNEFEASLKGLSLETTENGKIRRALVFDDWDEDDNGEVSYEEYLSYHDDDSIKMLRGGGGTQQEIQQATDKLRMKVESETPVERLPKLPSIIDELSAKTVNELLDEFLYIIAVWIMKEKQSCFQ
jgi:hypothetical protein